MRSQSPTKDNPHILPGPHFRSKFPNVEIEILRGRARQPFRKISSRAFLIGTAADCDMALGDPQFPEVYAYLFLSDQGVSLRYLGAGPILTVNGRLVQSAALFDGDVLRMASYEFLVHIDWNAGPERKKSKDSRTSHTAEEEQIGLEQVEELLCEVRGVFETSDPPWASSENQPRLRKIFTRRSGRETA